MRGELRRLSHGLFLPQAAAGKHRKGWLSMIRTTVRIAGMVCGMCEAHINDAIRNAFTVKKITSSRIKGEAIILSEAPPDTEKLKQIITSAGYTFPRKRLKRKGFCPDC